MTTEAPGADERVDEGATVPLSLAQYLGTVPLTPGESLAVRPQPEDIVDPATFAQALLTSFEFRQYIIHGLTLGSIPAAILIRVMDLAGWQKPPDRIEHTGKDGGPILFTKIERVIVDVPSVPLADVADAEYTTH